MSRYLCISVTLLDQTFHGKGENEEPEWPPSPMRLFQALVASSRTGCRNPAWSESKAQAYRWLERRSPPVIVGPPTRRAASYTLFVPNNDADAEKVWERQNRLTSKVVQPQRVMGAGSDTTVGEALYYLWIIPDREWKGAAPHAEVLCRDARHLTALGWGIDQAIGDGRILTEAEVPELPGRRWRPWHTHRPRGQELRVPRKGSLENLESVHASFVSRIDAEHFNPPLKVKRFDRVSYHSDAVLPPRSYAAFELPSGVAFRQDRAATMAAMVRSLACRCAKVDSHEFPGGPETYVAGHTERDASARSGVTPPRFSYLPLPTIGHGHADGLIRRVLIAEPYGGDGSHAAWAQHRLRNQALRDDAGDERGLLLELWRSSSILMVDRYVSESDTWTSVTPPVLPGFDDGKHTKAEALFLKAAAQSDVPIDAIDSITLRKAPFWPGAAHPRQYFVPEYLRRFPRWHVAVRFREPVLGPLAIGAGRHTGLGLLAAAGTRPDRL